MFYTDNCSYIKSTTTSQTSTNNKDAKFGLLSYLDDSVN